MSRVHRLALALAAALAIIAQPAAAATGWSAPRAIDQIEPLTQPFTGEASCPSTALCVVAGVDAVDTSTHPGAGPRAWHTTLLPGSVRISTISCPSVNECIGSGGFDRLTVSTDPTGGPRAWRSVPLSRAVTEVNDLDCADPGFCMLVGSGARIAWSTRPVEGRAAWHLGRVRGGGDLMSVSCPSRTLCVAAADDGNLAVSTDPLGGARTWRVVHLDVHSVSLGVVCPSIRLCVASDGQGGLLTSTDPAGGRRSWRPITLIHGRGDLDTPVCPSVSFCIVDNGRRTVWTATDPAGGVRAWRAHRADFAAGVAACAGVQVCLAEDQAAVLAASTDPLRPTRWRRLLRNGGNDLEAVACPSRSLCIAGDDAGNLLSARGPRARHWRDTGFARVLRRRYRGHEQVLQLACAGPHRCLVTVVSSDNEGEQGQLYTFDPRDVAGTLERVALRAPGTLSPEFVGRLGCPMRGLCELLDHPASGPATRLVSRDPADPAAWAPVPGAPPPRSACPSPTRCLAPAGHGRLTLLARRGARFVALRTLKVLRPGPVDAVSCAPGPTGCIAVGPGGVAVSINPTAPGTWRFAASKPLGLLPRAAACAVASACVAVGVYGKAVATTPPLVPAAHPRHDCASPATVTSMTPPSGAHAIRSSDCRRSSSSWKASAWAPLR